MTNSSRSQPEPVTHPDVPQRNITWRELEWARGLLANLMDTLYSLPVGHEDIPVYEQLVRGTRRAITRWTAALLERELNDISM